MKDITTAEAYFLCAVQSKGKIFGHDDSKIACLLAAVFHEMKNSGLIELAGTKIKVIQKKELPANCAAYLAPVIGHLRELDSLELRIITQDYNSGWSDRRLNALTTVIGTGLADRGLATKAKLGLFNGRVYFMPHKTAIPSLAAELLVNILYQTPIASEDGFLWLLLEKSSCIPKDFSAQQRQEIHEKVAAAIQFSPETNLAKLDMFTDKLLSLVKHYPI